MMPDRRWGRLCHCGTHEDASRFRARSLFLGKGYVTGQWPELECTNRISSGQLPRSYPASGDAGQRAKWVGRTTRKPRSEGGMGVSPMWPRALVSSAGRKASPLRRAPRHVSTRARTPVPPSSWVNALCQDWLQEAPTSSAKTPADTPSPPGRNPSSGPRSPQAVRPAWTIVRAS